jgi:hypothetical protein
MSQKNNKIISILGLILTAGSLGPTWSMEGQGSPMENEGENRKRSRQLAFPRKDPDSPGSKKYIKKQRFKKEEGVEKEARKGKWVSEEDPKNKILEEVNVYVHALQNNPPSFIKERGQDFLNCLEKLSIEERKELGLRLIKGEKEAMISFFWSQVEEYKKSLSRGVPPFNLKKVMGIMAPLLVKNNFWFPFGLHHFSPEPQSTSLNSLYLAPPFSYSSSPLKREFPREKKVLKDKKEDLGREFSLFPDLPMELQTFIISLSGSVFNFSQLNKNYLDLCMDEIFLKNQVVLKKRLGMERKDIKEIMPDKFRTSFLFRLQVILEAVKEREKEGDFVKVFHLYRKALENKTMSLSNILAFKCLKFLKREFSGFNPGDLKEGSLEETSYLKKFKEISPNVSSLFTENIVTALWRFHKEWQEASLGKDVTPAEVALRQKFLYKSYVFYSTYCDLYQYCSWKKKSSQEIRTDNWNSSHLQMSSIKRKIMSVNRFINEKTPTEELKEEVRNIPGYFFRNLAGSTPSWSRSYSGEQKENLMHQAALRGDRIAIQKQEVLKAAEV